jgi:hypothetical protein
LRDDNRNIRKIISNHFLKISLYFLRNLKNPLHLNKILLNQPYYIAYNYPKLIEHDPKIIKHIYIYLLLNFVKLYLNPLDF